MKTNKLLVVTGLLIMLTGCNLPLPENTDMGDNFIEDTVPTATQEPAPPTVEEQASQDEDSEINSKPSRLVHFDQLGISLEVPVNLHVQKDPLVSFDDPSRLESYLFYIQNYGFPGGPSSGDFQIYGHLQYDLPLISWDEFARGQVESTMNAYVKEIEINGLRGLDTQLSGERPRYVYHFLLEGHVLSLAVAAPTEDNKALADQIVSTILYDPEKFTNASRVKKIVEPSNYYHMYIPDDWNYSFEPVAGVRISDLRANSPDADLFIEETDGPHSNFYYKNGIFMDLVILEGDSASMEPVMAEVIRSGIIMLSGIEMNDYVFREPSTVEGEIRELRFSQDGLSYQLRFSYGPNADQDQINWIIRNLVITP